MDKFIEWLGQKFSHPLSLLFFILGVILLLLGLTTGFEIPIIKQVSPAIEYREISLILGCICLILSIFIYYKPPHKNQTYEKGNAELPASFFAREALISETQRGLLKFIEWEVSVLNTDIQSKYRNMGQKELFYRLEQLRLLGFIEREKIGKPNDTTGIQMYQLSKKYQDEKKGTIGHLSGSPTSEPHPPSPKRRSARKGIIDNQQKD